MNADISVKNPETAIRHRIESPLVGRTEVSGGSGRHKVGFRVSAPAEDLPGFENTIFRKAWITVEVSEELPHKLHDQALREVSQTCRDVAVEGLSAGFEMLLAFVSLSEDDQVVLKRIARDPGLYTRNGVHETVLRLLRMCPAHAWNALTPEEQEVLRGIG